MCSPVDRIHDGTGIEATNRYPCGLEYSDIADRHVNLLDVSKMRALSFLGMRERIV